MPAESPRYRPDWATHDKTAMDRDFLLFRHLRVAKARSMRQVHRLASAAFSDEENWVVKTVYGVDMTANWGDRTFAYCHYGTYGRYLSDLLASLDKPFAFIDIGANQGLYSLLAGQNPACQRVLAVEPVPSTFKLLEKNIALNGLSEKAMALNFGISDVTGDQIIAIKKEHSGAATLESHLPPGSPATSNQIVKTRHVNEVLSRVEDDLPLFIKIDVEGHEACVIDQLLHSDAVDRILGIFFEFDERWGDGSTINKAFREKGFSIRYKYGRGRHYDVLATPED